MRVDHPKITENVRVSEGDHEGGDKAEVGMTVDVQPPTAGRGDHCDVEVGRPKNKPQEEANDVWTTCALGRDSHLKSRWSASETRLWSIWDGFDWNFHEIRKWIFQCAQCI
jgi:hypothetical protein